MMAKVAGIASLCLLLAACAAPSPAPPPPPPEAALPAPVPAEAGPRVVDLRTLTCASLMNAAQEDRAFGSVFLLGYEAAVTGRRLIDVDRIEGLEKFALEECADNPTMPASLAFARALRSRTLAH